MSRSASCRYSSMSSLDRSGPPIMAINRSSSLRSIGDCAGGVDVWGGGAVLSGVGVWGGACGC